MLAGGISNGLARRCFYLGPLFREGIVSTEIHYILMWLLGSLSIYCAYKLGFLAQESMVVAVAVCAPLAIASYEIRKLETQLASSVSVQKESADLLVKFAAHLNSHADQIDQLVENVKSAEADVAKLQSEMREQTSLIKSAFDIASQVRLERDLDKVDEAALKAYAVPAKPYKPVSLIDPFIESISNSMGVPTQRKSDAGATKWQSVCDWLDEWAIKF